MPKPPLTDQFKLLGSKILESINDLIKSAFPKDTWIAVLVISVSAGYFLKRRYKVGGLEFLLISLTIFFALRYFGIGD